MPPTIVTKSVTNTKYGGDKRQGKPAVHTTRAAHNSVSRVRCFISPYIHATQYPLIKSVTSQPAREYVVAAEAKNVSSSVVSFLNGRSMELHIDLPS